MVRFRPSPIPVAHACPVDAEAAARHLRRVDPGDGSVAWIWNCGHEAVTSRGAPRVERCPWCGLRLRQARRTVRERQLVALSALYVLVSIGAGPASGMGPRVLDLLRQLRAARGREERRVRRDVAGLVHGNAKVYLASLRRACEERPSAPRILGILRGLWVLVAYRGKNEAGDELVALGRALDAGAAVDDVAGKLRTWLDEHADETIERMKAAFAAPPGN